MSDRRRKVLLADGNTEEYKRQIEEINLVVGAALDARVLLSSWRVLEAVLEGLSQVTQICVEGLATFAIHQLNTASLNLGGDLARIRSKSALERARLEREQAVSGVL